MEKSYFFDSTTDDQRIYQAADFAQFHTQIIGDGVSNTANLPDLEVTARDNMNVALGAGYMFANGYMYENDSALTLKHDIADSIDDRIDRVVIQFNNDPSERRVFAYVKKGVPSSNPVPPTVERTVYIHEMSVAQVKIIAGKSYIEQTEITDERTDDAVCGYIPLHNIYRGLQINEVGMVTMPNQSFVDVRSDAAGYEIEPGDEAPIIPINYTVTDRQNEIDNNTFTPKADGVYHIWVQIRASEIVLRDLGISSTKIVDLQTTLIINGEYPELPIGAQVVSNYADNIWTFSQPIPLQAGDELQFQAKSYRFNENIPAENIWIRIFKVS